MSAVLIAGGLILAAVGVCLLAFFFILREPVCDDAGRGLMCFECGPCADTGPDPACPLCKGSACRTHKGSGE